MNLHYREATEQDIPALVNMLAADSLGKLREDHSTPVNPCYLTALQHISNDPNNELTVVESHGDIVGMLQLTFIPYLTYKGAWRCLIEGVRIKESYRGKGLGTQFFQWAIERAKARQCHIVQLTSDKQRTDAIRFYEQLGFIASHEGFKLKL
ncbi:MAG: GNAT family N-acetyltransferase [Leucothrix sp.]